ncbi:MAG: hypothetical protein SOW52_07805 [Enterococcus casseliflavus]|nr:hypothetical protein [Enterococcus casseliflavus]
MQTNSPLRRACTYTHKNFEELIDVTTKELKALIEQFEDKDEIEFCVATSEGNGYSDEIFLGKVTQKAKESEGIQTIELYFGC